jgi:hypothetical protein
VPKRSWPFLRSIPPSELPSTPSSTLQNRPSSARQSGRRPVKKHGRCQPGYGVAQRQDEH